MLCPAVTTHSLSFDEFDSVYYTAAINGKLYTPLNTDEGYGLMVYDFDTGERPVFDGAKTGTICDLSEEMVVTCLHGDPVGRELPYEVYRFADGVSREFTAVPSVNQQICGNYVCYLSAGNSCILHRMNVETGETEQLTEIGCRNFTIDEKKQVLYYQSFYDPRQICRILLQGDSWTRVDEAPEMPGPDDVWGYYHTDGEQEPVVSLALYRDGTFFLHYSAAFDSAISGTYEEDRGVVRLKPTLFTGDDEVLEEMWEIVLVVDPNDGMLGLTHSVYLTLNHAEVTWKRYRKICQ